MKNKTLFTTLLVLLTGLIYGQTTYVPDDNFENYLETHDVNGNTVPVGDSTSMGNGIANDDYITTANISGVTSLDVSSQNIADLTGIQDFAALQSLDCSNNPISNIDLSSNANLVNFSAFLTDMNTLDVSSNTNLSILDVNGTSISTLDLSNNSQLTQLGVASTQLLTLDVSNNHELTALNVSGNPISEINMANGNNVNLIYFNALNNPNLTCVQVDDPAYMNANWAGAISVMVSYSTNCNNVNQTYVPDDNFENYLETHDVNGNTVPVGDSTSMGNGIANDDYITTANISGVTSLFVSYQNIADLTGIQDFAALQSLDCSNNQLTGLDVTQNTALVFLFCQSNQLTSLDVTHNLTLQRLSCGYNQLSGLDVTHNTALTRLYCYFNQLTSLDISQNTTLTHLYCPVNQLASLDVTYNTDLQNLSCGNNPITSLDLSQNAALNSLACNYSQISNLDLTQNVALTKLFCHDTPLSNLDIRNGNNSNFTYFEAMNNPNLTCVFVDDASYMNSNWANAIDATANYVETQADCDALGIAEVLSQELKMYPNPVSDRLQVQTPYDLSYTVVNVTGAVVLQGHISSGQTSIATEKLISGVYFIKFETNDVHITKQLIKE